MFERNVTGLDLGSYSVKAVEMRADLRAAEIVRCSEWIYPTGASQEEIDAGIRAFLSREGFALEHVITAIAGRRLTQRHLGRGERPTRRHEAAPCAQRCGRHLRRKGCRRPGSR